MKALLLKSRYALKKVKEEYSKRDNFPIVIGGGVACNSELRLQFQQSYKNVFIVDPKFCTDNAAMIANYGLRNSEEAIPFPECLAIDARGRYINKKEMNK